MNNRPEGGVKFEAIKGDIVSQPDCDAVVNAANAELAPGGGVAGAIHMMAGNALYEECRKLAPISPGQAVITGAYGLPNKYVVHCLGPRYGIDEPSDRLLVACYRNALKVADEAGAESIAFPAISAGAFGYPLKEAAEIAVETIRSEMEKLDNIRLVRMVLYNDRALDAVKAAMDK